MRNWICVKCGARYPEGTRYCPRDAGQLNIDPLIGKEIGGRKLFAFLGRGGMASVYRARHPVLGPDQALKLLNSPLTSHPRISRLFQREAQIISRLATGHTVPILDFGRHTDGTIFIVMQFIEGQTLDLVLRDTPQLPVPRVMELMRQICEALGEAHASDIVHLDIKPANLILDARAGRRRGADFVRVLDFGVALVKSGTLMITEQGGILGTPAFMSPEQTKGLNREQLTAAADIYSLGVVAYTALRGHNPFREAAGPTAMMIRQREFVPPPLTDFLELPGELSELIARMLDKDPERRPTCDEVATLLDRMSHEPLEPTVDLSRSAALDRLACELREREQQLEAREQAVQEGTGRLRQHEQKLVHREAAAKEQMRVIDHERRRLAEQDTQLERHRSALESARSEVRRRERELAEIEVRLVRERESVEQIHASLELRQLELDRRSEDLDASHERLLELEAALEQRQELLDEAAAEHAAEVDLQQQQAEATRAEMAVEHAELARARAALEDERAELSRIRNDLGRLPPSSTRPSGHQEPPVRFPSTGGVRGEHHGLKRRGGSGAAQSGSAQSGSGERPMARPMGLVILRKTRSRYPATHRRPREPT